jgi:DNA-binding beta-propeller fold protein YncE
VAVLRNDKAYVSSMRDREIVVIDLRAQPPQVVQRIGVSGQPNRMIFNGAGTRLFVANGSSDSVSIIDTASGRCTSPTAERTQWRS